MTKKGMDVSYHQGTIDFKKAKKDGIDFVILREGYRKTIDKKFLEYVSGAQAAGIEIPGVYHFFYPLKESDVLLEAKSCIANVEKAGLSKDIIIFADLEYDTFTDAKEKGVTLKKSITTPWTIIFCDYVESQGYRAGVYLNQDYYKNYYDMGQILAKDYIIWLADYSGDPNYPCTYQQYSNKGKVSGISGNVDMNYFFGEEKKTEPVTECDTSQRQAVVDVFEGWKGYSETNGKHKQIVDIYNAYLATAVKVNGTINYRVGYYSDAWCATAISAAYIKAGLADAFPIECSCPRMITLAKKAGSWVEDDAYVPDPGDAVLYDWGDTGSGDNTGTPDHVGMVVSVDRSAGTMLVIEGNKNDAVEYRTLAINGRYIRGFVHTNISGTVSSKTETSASAPSKDVRWKGKVTASRLNVRTWAGTENDKCRTFGPLDKGTEVYICDEIYAADGSLWYYIKTMDSGKYGFCHSAFIRKEV